MIDHFKVKSLGFGSKSQGFRTVLTAILFLFYLYIMFSTNREAGKPTQIIPYRLLG